LHLPRLHFKWFTSFKIFMDFESMASDILSWLHRSRSAQLPSRVGNYVGTACIGLVRYDTVESAQVIDSASKPHAGA
jgi:hypothetical protein